MTNAPNNAEDWIDFYRINRESIVAFALHVTGSPEDAEDCIQNVLIKFVRRRADAIDQRAYFYRALRNTAFDLRKENEQRKSVSIGLIDPAVFLAEDSDALHDSAREALLRDAVRSLRPHQCETLVLRLFSGLSFREIGVALDRPLGTVTSDYARALSSIRSFVSPEASHA